MPLMYDESGHKMFDLSLLSTGGSRQFDTDKIINRYDQRIAMSVLSDFILLGHDRVGSYSLGTAKMDLWSMAVDAIANSIAEVINQFAIPRLLKLNGMDTARAPFLTYGEVSHIDLTEIGDYVSKLANSGLIMSDPNLEDYLRELGGLPPADHNNAEAMGVAPKGKDEFLTDDEYALINDVADGGQTASPTEDVE
jgi:phage gp29-like protein